MTYADGTNGIQLLLRAGGAYDSDSTVSDTDLVAIQAKATRRVNVAVRALGFVQSSIAEGTASYDACIEIEDLEAAIIALLSSQANVDPIWLRDQQITLAKMKGRNELGKALASDGVTAVSAGRALRVGQAVTERQANTSTVQRWPTGTTYLGP